MKALLQHRFLVLLVCLIGYLFGLPLMSGMVPLTGFLSRSVFSLLLVFLLLGAVYSISAGRVSGFVAALASGTIVSQAVYWVSDSATAKTVAEVLATFFFLVTAWAILKWLARARSVDRDTISAAICLYLIIGVTWALGYTLLERSNPRSFTTAADVTVDSMSMGFGVTSSADAIYFSFVTLSTLGYGDITPNTSTARMLTVAEALLGQCFLAILVARLVGIEVNQRMNQGSAPSHDRKKADVD